jgi:hypothetical protein
MYLLTLVNRITLYEHLVMVRIIVCKIRAVRLAQKAATRGVIGGLWMSDCRQSVVKLYDALKPRVLSAWHAL